MRQPRVFPNWLDTTGHYWTLLDTTGHYWTTFLPSQNRNLISLDNSAVLQSKEQVTWDYHGKARDLSNDECGQSQSHLPNLFGIRWNPYLIRRSRQMSPLGRGIRKSSDKSHLDSRLPMEKWGYLLQAESGAPNKIVLYGNWRSFTDLKADSLSKDGGKPGHSSQVLSAIIFASGGHVVTSSYELQVSRTQNSEVTRPLELRILRTSKTKMEMQLQ